MIAVLRHSLYVSGWAPSDRQTTLGGTGGSAYAAGDPSSCFCLSAATSVR
jgi:hypothetical protein